MTEDATAVYALGSSAGESARLLRQAEELSADSAALLDKVGLRPGQSAIDLGCGPRGVLDLLAARVSPGGRVVGLDADPAHTAAAAGFAAERGLGGVEVMTGTPGPRGCRLARSTWSTRGRCWSTCPTRRSLSPR